MKSSLITLGVFIALVAVFFTINAYIYSEKQAVSADSYKDAEYHIEGKRVQLKNGVAESEAAPGSSSKIITQYFGNEVFADLDHDGREDVVFLLSQETGGAGTFYYVVAALNTLSGYRGSAALFLGDRIAPQTTEMSRNPSHQNVLIVNYADRAPGEPITTPPSVGKSIWLKLDPEALQFGEVAQNFEGEADPSRMTLTMKTWKWISVIYSDGKKIVPKEEGSFTLAFASDGSFSATTDCNSVGGKYVSNAESIEFMNLMSTLKYCEDSQEGDFIQILENIGSYHFTSRGQLIFDLKSDSGVVEFL